MTRMELIDFREEFDKTKVVTSSEPLDTRDSSFNVKGIFSEDIFGKEQDPDTISNIGWIDFDGNYIINPLFIARLESLFKKSVLHSIISYDRKVDANGKILDLEIEEKPKVSDKYRSIGLVEFKEHFLEILDDCIKPDKRNSDTHKIVLDAYINEKLFIDCFPITSPKLRPAFLSRTENTFRFTEVNNFYNFIVAHSNTIKELLKISTFEKMKLQLLPILYELQTYCSQVLDFTISKELSGKKGTFRKIMLASRVNFSARNVIVPDPTLEVHQLSFNYRTFIRLYEPLLVNLIVKTKKISPNKALHFVKKYTTIYSDEMYKYICELINKTDGGMFCLLNRNWIAA